MFVLVVQFAPLSVLYCQVALASMPVMLSIPLLVSPSVADVPVSACSAIPGAAGGVVSMVMAAGFWMGVVVFPAWSVCLIWMTPAA